MKLKASTTTRDAWKSLQLVLHRLPCLWMPGAQVPPGSFPTPSLSKWRLETAGRNPESLRPCQCKMLTAWIPPHIHWSSGATLAARSGFSSYESEGSSLGVPGWTLPLGLPPVLTLSATHLHMTGLTLVTSFHFCVYAWRESVQAYENTLTMRALAAAFQFRSAPVFFHWLAAICPPVASPSSGTLACHWAKLLPWNCTAMHTQGGKRSVAQLCLTLCNPMDYSPPGCSVHGISQAKTLEWVAISFSRGSSQPRYWAWVSCITGRFFTIWATREAPGWWCAFIGEYSNSQWADSGPRPLLLALAPKPSLLMCLQLAPVTT